MTLSLMTCMKSREEINNYQLKIDKELKQK